MQSVWLRWLNTVLRAASGNSRNGACFKLDKNLEAKKAMVHRRRFLKIYSLKFCDILQNFYSYRILSNENFKMEVEQANFCDTFFNYSTIILLII